MEKSKAPETEADHHRNTEIIPQLDGSPEVRQDTAKGKSQFKCDQCRFEASTENKLQYHTRLKHRTHHCDPGFEEYDFLPNNICPLCPVESDYCKCGSCEECQDFITEHGFNIHMMNDHSPDDILAHFGEDWIKEHTQYIHRNVKYTEDRNHSKMWDIFLSEKDLVQRMAQPEAKPECSVTNVLTVEASQWIFVASIVTIQPKPNVCNVFTHSAPLGEKW